jgi:hypothetical protein
MPALRRREFILLLGGVAVARPLAARSSRRRIGGLVNTSENDPEGRNRVCRAQFGWSDGRNVAIDRIMAHPLWRLHRGVGIT